MTVLAVVAVLALVGCATVSVPGGSIDRQRGVVTFEAMGQAVATQETPLAMAQARLAAATIAKGCLLEKIKGAAVEAYAGTEDLQFSDSEVRSRTEGWLSRAEVTYEDKARMGESPVVTAVAMLTLPVKEYDLMLEDLVD
jgi:hypothetical protein